jgi:hypothetical protein
MDHIVVNSINKYYAILKVHWGLGVVAHVYNPRDQEDCSLRPGWVKS